MKKLAAFGLVGLTAAGVHYLVVWLLVSHYAVAPLAANVGGFLVAFWTSFFGHRHLSFAHARPAPVRQSLPRFAAVALTGFAVNESLYAWLLAYTPLPYTWALVLVLGTVAVATYLLSRFWAFLPA